MRVLSRPRIFRFVAISTTALAIPILAAQPVHAQWGVCANDPKVWLTNGAQIAMATGVQVDPSLVSQISFTLHTPVGTTATKIVHTGGPNVPPETVNVVSDSTSGYTVAVSLSLAGGDTYQVNLTVHAIDQGSSWASASGTTSQPVGVTVGQ